MLLPFWCCLGMAGTSSLRRRPACNYWASWWNLSLERDLKTIRQPQHQWAALVCPFYSESHDANFICSVWLGKNSAFNFPLVPAASLTCVNRRYKKKPSKIFCFKWIDFSFVCVSFNFFQFPLVCVSFAFSCLCFFLLSSTSFLICVTFPSPSFPALWSLHCF